MNSNKVTNLVLRGQIYMADLGIGKGSEQSGLRPVIVVQNDVGNKFSPTVIVATITSRINKAKLPTHVLIDTECGLEQTSVALFEQIRTIDKSRLSKYIGKVDENTLDKINKAINISFDLEVKKSNTDKILENKLSKIDELSIMIDKMLMKTNNKFTDLILDFFEERNLYIEDFKEFAIKNSIDWKAYINRGSKTVAM